MTKKIILSLLALSLLITIPVSDDSMNLSNKADSLPTIAILDTALDTSLPIFRDKIVLEACVVQWNSCPNGMSEMEGPSSATMKTEWLSRNGFNHGTEMASLAIQANPNVRIVFVKIIGNTDNGSRQLAGEKTVYNALDWVLKNKDRLNIQAVSMSQGHHNLGSGQDYCPKTPITEDKINALASAGVPVFFPTGNTRDYSRIDWPACIPASIAVGATMPTDSIAIYSNHDPRLTDFFAQGTIQATTVGGAKVNVGGTSAATVIAATQWATIKAANPSLTYSEIYELISKTSKPTSNSNISGGKLIDLSKALSQINSIKTVNIVKPLPAIDKTLLIAEANKAVALAEEQYKIEVKAAADKLAAIKLEWSKKVNG